MDHQEQWTGLLRVLAQLGEAMTTLAMVGVIGSTRAPPDVDMRDWAKRTVGDLLGTLAVFVDMNNLEDDNVISDTMRTMRETLHEQELTGIAPRELHNA